MSEKLICKIISLLIFCNAKFFKVFIEKNIKIVRFYINISKSYLTECYL